MPDGRYENECHTEFDEKCETRYEEKCETKYETVNEQVDPHCHFRYPHKAPNKSDHHYITYHYFHHSDNSGHICKTRISSSS